MCKPSKRTMLYLAIIIGILIIVANVFDKAPPSLSESVPSVELDVPSPQIEPVTATEMLYVLTKANIRGGPGKDYKVTEKLGIFEKIEVEKKFVGNGKWRKLVFPNQGYIFHTLIGPLVDARKIFVDEINRFTQELMNAGVITKIDGWTIYVNRYAWIELGEMTTTPFIRGYGAVLKIKKPNRNISIDVIDYYSGRRILTYKVNMDMFFMN